MASTGSSTNPYTFAATSRYRNDGDAGLAHVRARYYDEQVGRFVTRDTVLEEKPYTYCEGDSVNWLDPSGNKFDGGGIWDKLRRTVPTGSIGVA
jgi:RHS repeat-associated protein